MSKVLPYEEAGGVTGYMIFCPACRSGHLFNTTPNLPNGVGGKRPAWAFDGNLEEPTFSPSMLVTTNDPSHPHHQPRAAFSRCHSFVTAGKIQFQRDCTHPLAGTTVDLPDWEEMKNE